MIGIPAEININDCNTCQYTDWHELKACAFTERTNISNVWTSPRPIQKNSRPPAGSSCGLTKAKKRAEEKLKGKDGLEYFIPKYYAVRVYHGVKSKRLVPVIPNLVFVHASRIQITEFKKRYNFLQFVMWEKSTGLEYLVVPDDQMESFIRVSSQYEENISYYNPDELDLRKGRRVRIHGGKLNGVMGVFMQVQGKRNRRVVVLLEGVMAVAAEVHPDLIEVIS